MLIFPIARDALRAYELEKIPFASSEGKVFPDFKAARRFAQRISEKRSQPVPPGSAYALGLLLEASHILLRQYELQNPSLLKEALARLQKSEGRAAVEALLLAFVEQFPPQEILNGDMSPREWVEKHRQTALEEIFLLPLWNENPALTPFQDFFDDSPLKKESVYPRALSRLDAFFRAAPPFGEEKVSLPDALRAPVRAAPESLAGQLQYLIEHWGALLGEEFIRRALRGIDFLREESSHRAGTGGAEGPAPVLEFHGGEEEEVRFSPDRAWMPNLVLIAKNVYVWLDQLSKRYERGISRLDSIPDEELDALAQRGFTGLWLIGLWERSRASKKIKQMMGNPDAAASAYALDDYRIAEELGGQEALENLRRRAWHRGIRLAADMVPNHMGIDSRWVIEHPERFLSLDEPPYPSYTFDGPNLCDDARVSIYLEDHYYDHSDAAVVFKRVDTWTGETRYIYHGNDGTSMPWNDTAQLDFLKPEVREAALQTILEVARQFPIIRFDAAMTLAKKHIQRLWYPEPGAGGAIPSRAAHGLPRAEFEKRMPREFWREVVDRVAEEVPDTLLLAEAFWLMEGYFVRTLGMHRVYNSAFMHMLRDEDNAGYRQVVKNTLEFDPQILKRFVNFMNNPDEETAVAQFGKGDKYFGVCTLLVTMPGLPMFGHGQVEGFEEKYGMEYRRAYRDEVPDEGFIAYHEKTIFPLLRRRALFADVENFLFYHFFDSDGRVVEDVFAYSNRLGEERALILYHNKYAEASGWIRTSVSFAVNAGGEEYLARRTLAEGLALPDDAEAYVLFRDMVSGLEYIRSCRDLSEKGLFVSLGAYQRQVFLDFRIVRGDGWAELCEKLNGEGRVDLEKERESLLNPVPDSVKKADSGKEAESRLKTNPSGESHALR